MTLDLIRIGTYGGINVVWTAGVADADLPAGVSNGVMTPTSGTTSMPHGVDAKQFTSTYLYSELFGVSGISRYVVQHLPVQ